MLGLFAPEPPLRVIVEKSRKTYEIDEGVLKRNHRSKIQNTYLYHGGNWFVLGCDCTRCDKRVINRFPNQLSLRPFSPRHQVVFDTFSDREITSYRAPFMTCLGYLFPRACYLLSVFCLSAKHFFGWHSLSVPVAVSAGAFKSCVYLLTRYAQIGVLRG